MKWIVTESGDELSQRAARLLLDALAANPRAVLGLPTGRTPEGMYARIRELCSRQYHCFTEATTFNLDEYVGIGRDHPGSYSSYMRRNLFEHVDIDFRRVHIPDGTASAVRQRVSGIGFEEALLLTCQEYEDALRAAGSLGVTFLGLGTNGHIAFNEPGTPFDIRTHLVTLDASTRKANASHFPDGDVPERAITMGIGTILESVRIILLASGRGKAPAIARLREGERSPAFPASALLDHPDVTVITDRDASGVETAGK